MTRDPDFVDLVGSDLPPEEADRLRGVHDLLVAAGPPPELPPSLQHPPEVGGTVTFLPRRRRGALLLLAAAIAAAAFGGGYLVAGRGGSSGFKAVRVVPMHGTKAAPNALASIQIGKADRSGNWPMLVRVTGLPRAPRGGYYELYLTRKGRVLAPCGTFNVHSGTTSVSLNAPYRLKNFDGWVVTLHRRGGAEPGAVALTT